MGERGGKFLGTELLLLAAGAVAVWVTHRSWLPCEGTMLNGTPFDTGAQSLPFAATRSGDLQLAFDGLDLAPWLPYLPASLPVRVQRGRVDSQLGLHFSLPPQAQPEVALKGRIALRALGNRKQCGGSTLDVTGTKANGPIIRHAQLKRTGTPVR